jgi:hypothetical protein
MCPKIVITGKYGKKKTSTMKRIVPIQKKIHSESKNTTTNCYYWMGEESAS